MLLYLIAVLTLLTSLGLSWLMIQRPVASDVPEDRSFHSTVTARGGGLAVILSWLMFLSLVNALGFPIFTYHINMLIGCSVFMGVIGFLDDRLGLHAVWRFLGQIFVALVVIANGFYIDHIPLPGIQEIPLGALGPIITLFWVVGFINAFNFMDGLNGLAASGATVVAILLLLFMPYTTPLNFIFYGLICALLGFLRYNFINARLFMGDTGSQFLGCLFALTSLMIDPITGTLPYYVIPLLFLPFIADTSITFANQVVRRRNVLHPHRMHMIHRLHDSGLKHIHVTLIYLTLIVLQGVFVAYFLPQPSFLKLGLNFGFYIILAAIVYVVSYSVRKRAQ